jgi:hypothetical protein
MNWPDGANVDDPGEVVGAEVTLEGLESGTYAVQWWDTLEGRVVGSVEIEIEEDRLTLAPPPFQVDLAARVKRR